MPINRIIPVLLTDNKRLVKTIGFKDPVYIGDPVNTARILNDKQVPELMLLDIGATRDNREPDYGLISKVAGECTVPLIYGGGIGTAAIAGKVFACGVEKVSLNTAAFYNPGLIGEIAGKYGSQSVVVSMDVKAEGPGAYSVYIANGTLNTETDPSDYAIRSQQNGCGEILLNSIDRDGTFRGYDISLVQDVSAAVGIPVIACGGAGSFEDLGTITRYGASAAAAGSIFFFKGKHKAVLISFPSWQPG